MSLTSWQKFQQAQTNNRGSAADTAGSLSNDEDERKRRAREQYAQYLTETTAKVDANATPAWAKFQQEQADKTVNVPTADMSSTTARTMAYGVTNRDKDIMDYKTIPDNVRASQNDLNSLDSDTQDQLNRYGQKYHSKASEMFHASDDVARSMMAKDKGWDNDTLNKYISDAKTVGQYNYDKEKKNTVLTPDEELKYSQASIDSLSDGERKLMNDITAGSKKNFDYNAKVMAPGGIRNLTPSDTQSKESGQNQIDTAQSTLKDKYGWDDDKIKNYSLMADRLANKKGTDEQEKKFYIDPQESTGKKILQSTYNTAHDLIQAPSRGITGLLSNVNEKPEGFGRDIYDPTNLGENTSQEATSQVVNNAITNKHKIGQTAYNIGVSAAESAELSALGGAFSGGTGTAKAIGEATSLLPFSADSYNQMYTDARRRGVSDSDAQKTAIAAGAAEAITEEISLDNLWGLASNSKAGRNMFVNWLAHAGIEGSEEGIGDVLNQISDYAINDTKGQTQYQIDTEDNMAQGMDEEAAKKAAGKTFLQNTLMDTFAGAVSGGLIGAAGIKAGIDNSKVNTIRDSAIKEDFSSVPENIQGDSDYAVNARQQAETYKNNPTQYIADTIDDSTEEGKTRKAKVQELAQKEASGQKLSMSDKNYIEESIWTAEDEAKRANKGKANDYANATSSVPIQYRVPATSITEDEARTELEQAAVKGDAEALGNTYNKMKNAMSADIRNRADDIMSLYEGQAQSHGATAAQIAAYKVSAQDAYLNGLKGDSSTQYISPKAQEAYNSGQIANKISHNATTIDTKDSIKNLSVSTYDGRKTVLSGTFTDDGRILSQDGHSVDLNDIQLNNSALEKAYLNAKEQPSAASRNAYLNLIKDGTNINKFDIAWGRFFNGGLEGAKYDTVLNESGNKYIESVMGSDVAHAMYEEGRNQLNTEQKQKIIQDVNNKFNVKKGTGVFQDARTDKSNNIDTRALESIANASGFNVVLVDDLGNSANAYTDVKNSTITLSASATGQVFHEAIGEISKFYNSAEYNKFVDAAMDTIYSTLGPEETKRITDAYKKSWAKAGQNSSTAAMRDEMANDLIAVAAMTDKGREATSKYLSEHCTEKEVMTIKDHIANIFKSIARSIKNLFEHTKLNTMQKEMYQKGYKQLEDMSESMNKMFDNAIKNYQNTAEGTELNGEKAFSLQTNGINYLYNNMVKKSDIQIYSPTDFKLNDLEYTDKTNTSDIKTVSRENIALYNDAQGNNLGSNALYNKELNTNVLVGSKAIKHGLNTITPDKIDAKIYLPLYFENAVILNEASGMRDGAEKAYVMFGVFRDNRDAFNISDRLARVVVNHNSTGYYIDGFEDAIYAIKVKGGAAVNPAPLWNQSSSGITPPSTYKISQLFNLVKTYFPGDVSQDVAKKLNYMRPASDISGLLFSLKVAEDTLPMSDKLTGKAPVEQTKDLIAVHNMSESALAADFKLGGMPSPSLAIIKAGMEHSDYGDISLLFNKDTIDPENKKNKVYGGDGYTPTFPHIDNKISEKESKKLRDTISNLIPHRLYSALDYNDVKFNADNMSDATENSDVRKAYFDDLAVQYAYLASKGEKIDEGKTERGQESKYTHNYAELKTFSDEISKNEAQHYIENYDNNTLEDTSEYKDKVLSTANLVSHERYKDKLSKPHPAFVDKMANVDDLTSRDLYKISQDIVRYDEKGIEYVPDDNALKDNVKNAISKDQSGYGSWFDKTFGKVIEKQGIRNDSEYLDRNGNRRNWNSLHTDVTLENLVNAMNSRDDRGDAAFLPASEFKAISNKEFNSIYDIHNNEYLLNKETQEEHDKNIIEMSSRFRDICLEITDPSERDEIGGGDTAARNIVDAVRENNTAAGIDKYLRRYMPLTKADTAKKIIDLMHDISEMPTGYFEAKPQRAVGMNEIQMAVVPDSITKETAKLLSDNGIPYTMYKSGDEEERTKILSNQDNLKFSISIDDELDTYMEDNSSINSSASILEEGMEALKHKDVDVKMVRRIASNIKSDYGSTIKLEELTGDIRKAFAIMQSEDHVNYKDMMRIMNEIASPVIDQSTNLVGKQEYDDFINKFKGTSIGLSSTQIEEVKSTFGSVGEYRRAMMPLNISLKADMDMETRWGDITEAAGGVLDADTSEGDQPEALYDALNAMRPTVVNNFGGDNSDVKKDLGMRIVEDYLNSQTDAKAQKAAQKFKDNLTMYREKVRERYDARYKAAKDKLWKTYKTYKQNVDIESSKRIADIIARNKESAKNVHETATANHEKDMIRKQASSLLKWISEPTEEHHVPPDMVEPISQMLYAMDFVKPEVKQNSKGEWFVRIFDHSVINSDGSRSMNYQTLYGDSEEEVIDKFNTAIGNGMGSKSQQKWAEKMRSITEVFDSVQKEDQFRSSDMIDFMQNIDPAMAEEFSDMLKRNNNVAGINELSSGDLKIINNAMKNIIQAVKIGNKALTQDATIAEMAQKTLKLADGYEDKAHGQFYNGANRLLNLDMATPETYFEDNNASDVYNSLRKGFNTKIADIRASQGYMQEILKDVSKADMRKWTGKRSEVHEFNVTDGTIRMNISQIMTLYELSKRKQATLHMPGGIKIDTVYVGGRELTQSRSLHLSALDIAHVTGILTEQQKTLADNMQYYMATECSKQGNEAAMKMYGYQKFDDKDYFPISVDRDMTQTLNSNIADDKKMNGIERSGFTKNIDPHAKNPILIKDIFDVFTKHVTDMAAYHGMAPAIKDANRWFNYHEVEDLESPSEDDQMKWTSTKQALNQINGQGGSQYYINLINDLNGNNDAPNVANEFNKLISNYKASAVGNNLRVIFQQPTAYMRAMDEIDSKYLTAALTTPGKTIAAGKKMREQSEICWWKSQGYFETSTGRSMKEIVTGTSNIMDEIKNKSMQGAEIADDVTWGALYNAVTLEQKDKYKDKGLTEAQLDEKIKDRFDDVIDKTQVVDSILHRTQWMRKNDKFSQIQSAFMAEPMKSYNMLMRAHVKDKREGTHKHMARAATTYAVTNILTTLAASIIDAFRNDDDDKKWADEYWKAFKGNIVDNLNPLNMIPWVKDVCTAIENAIEGNTYNNSSRFDTAAVTGLIDTTRQFFNNKDKKTTYGWYMAFARPLSQFTGIPLYNLTRDIVSITNQFGADLKKTKDTNPYESIYDSIEHDQDTEEAVQRAMENGGVISDVQSGIANKYRSDYRDALEDDPKSAEKIASEAQKGLIATGMTEQAASDEVKSWGDENYSYGKLDDAIESGENITEAMTEAMSNKEKDNIAKHIVNKYGSTIEYDEKNGIDDTTFNNVDTALKAIDPSYTYKSVLAGMEQKEKEAAEKKASEDARDTATKQTFKTIDSGGDYKAGVEAMIKTGMDYQDVKSALTAQYRKSFIDDYNQGKDVQTQMSRIATTKAYCDERSGLKIPKKYGGDYYQYEINILNKWLTEQK
jgi:hypothetical protein